MPRGPKNSQKGSSKNSGGRTVRAVKLGTKNTHKGGFPKGHKDKLRQQRTVLRAMKMKQVAEEKRLGTGEYPPRIVGILGANESANSELFFQQLGKHCEFDTSSTLPFTAATGGSQRFTFICDTSNNLQRCLDIAKVCDILVFCVDCSLEVQQALSTDVAGAGGGGGDDEEFDEGATVKTYFEGIGLCITDHTRSLIRSVNAQGAPTVVVALQGLLSEVSERRRNNTLHLHQRYFRSVLPAESNVLMADDLEAILRCMSTIKVRKLPWREQRPYFIAESGDYDPESNGGTLSLSGYLRGTPLSANMLVHITNHGTFQISSISYDGDPCPVVYADDEEMGPHVIDESAEATREPLQCIQGNPTAMDEEALEQDLTGFDELDPKMRIKVPVGTSAYQAAWYVHEEELHDQDGATLGSVLREQAASTDARRYGTAAGEGHDGGHVQMVAGADDEEEPMAMLDLRSQRTGTAGGGDIEAMRAQDIIGFERMTDEQRLEELERHRMASLEERRHPDEMDTPLHISARQRFSKYRGVASFKKAKWDPLEGLPLDYSRIFKLQGYNAIRTAAIAKTEDLPARVGTFVTIHMINVPPTVWDLSDDLLIVSGQLEHEQKWSLLHFHVQRDSEHTEPVKSKAPMLVHVGFRKFFSRPIYSDATPGDRAHFSRYFHGEEKFQVASFYGPISYHPCPILMFPVEPGADIYAIDDTPLFAFGSAMPPNTDRIILKRVVLTGRIAVIYKKQVVIKYLFYNADDVRWFAPLDLYTRMGRRGKIIKPIGEHGLFKAQFNDVIMQHDIVCLDLYKRVFPKWKTVPFNVAHVVGDDEEGDGAAATGGDEQIAQDD